MNAAFEALLKKLPHIRYLIVSDVDETLTQKVGKRVELNHGVQALFGLDAHVTGAMQQVLNQSLIILSTGRIPDVAQNLKREVNGALAGLKAPHFLSFGNGAACFLNPGESTWEGFLNRLETPEAEAFKLPGYDAFLHQHFSHDARGAIEDQSLPPSPHFIYETLLQHLSAVCLEHSPVLAVLNPLAVEQFSPTTTPKAFRGFEAMVNTQRGQALQLAFGVHIAVPVSIRQGLETPTMFAGSGVEHLMVAVLKDDPKPLIFSMGINPIQCEATPTFQAILERYTQGEALEAVFQHNLRACPSTATDGKMNPLQTLIESLQASMRERLAPFGKNHGLTLPLSVQTQVKRLNDPIARESTNSPRGYLIYVGLMDKGMNVEVMLRVLDEAAKRMGLSNPLVKLEAIFTFGDGNVDYSILARHHFSPFGQPGQIFPCYPCVVGKPDESPEENRLFQRVQQISGHAVHTSNVATGLARLIALHEQGL